MRDMQSLNLKNLCDGDQTNGLENLLINTLIADNNFQTIKTSEISLTEKYLEVWTLYREMRIKKKLIHKINDWLK